MFNSVSWIIEPQLSQSHPTNYMKTKLQFNFFLIIEIVPWVDVIILLRPAIHICDRTDDKKGQGEHTLIIMVAPLFSWYLAGLSGLMGPIVANCVCANPQILLTPGQSAHSSMWGNSYWKTLCFYVCWPAQSIAQMEVLFQTLQKQIWWDFFW